MKTDTRTLKDLRSVGPRTIEDLHLLGIKSVADLATRDPDVLFTDLCTLTRSRQDPCVHDVFVCAVAQARDPNLPAEQRDWWWWSAVRKGARSA